MRTKGDKVCKGLNCSLVASKAEEKELDTQEFWETGHPEVLEWVKSGWVGNGVLWKEDWSINWGMPEQIKDLMECNEVTRNDERDGARDNWEDLYELMQKEVS